MIGRRAALSGVVAGVGLSLSGCDSRAEPSASHAPPDSAGDDATVVATPLGSIRLVAPRAEQARWTSLLVPAAAAVANRWGRGAEIAVRICDDATFDALEDGLDAGTAAVTTAQGVFVGPAVARSVTPSGRTLVLAHELTHARLGHSGNDRTQWWVKEGAAEWTAWQAMPQSAAAIRWPLLLAARARGEVAGVIPPERSVGTDLGYEWADAAFSYLVDVAGWEAAKRLVLRRPGDAHADVARLTRDARSFDAWLSTRQGQGGSAR